jgi:hypothetical protein
VTGPWGPVSQTRANTKARKITETRKKTIKISVSSVFSAFFRAFVIAFGLVGNPHGGRGFGVSLAAWRA